MNTKSKSQILKNIDKERQLQPEYLQQNFKKKEKKFIMVTYHYRLIKPACDSLEAETSLFGICSFLRKNNQGKENGRLQKTTDTFLNLLFTWDN